VGLSVPVFFTSVGVDGAQGPTLGDMRLSLPIGLVLPEDGGFGLSFVPYADLPTGNNSRFVGNSGFSAGGLVAASVTAGSLSLTGNLGAGVQSASDYLNLEGGWYIASGVQAAYQIGDSHAVGLETWLRPRLSTNAYGGSESPGELMLYGRGRYDVGLNWLLGGGLGITSGAGASNFRLFGGVGWTFGKQDEERDRDGDGILDRDDACPTEPETLNDYKDVDGCPDALADVVVTVLDEDGGPVVDAFVSFDGQEVRTDSEGRIRVSGRMPGTDFGVAVEHPWFLSGSVEKGGLEEGLNELTVQLAYKPSQVKVITRANTGDVLNARVQFSGPRPMADASVGEDGEEIFELRPGDWEILVSAPDFGVESRSLSLAPGETSLIVIEVTLFPAKVEVAADKVVILEKVYFDYDKDTILEKSLPLLREVANTLKANPSLLQVEIGGHTDVRGPADYNQELSQRRVESVKRFLVSNGVAENRLVPRGYGESKRIDKGSSEAAHARNRRVEFTILEKSSDAPEVRGGGQ
jgi:outer membrane protein OmpA-like peptidoglycan-associated protein